MLRQIEGSLSDINSNTGALEYYLQSIESRLRSIESELDRIRRSLP